MKITESETSYSLVQVIATIEWTQLWISCLQLATKFIISSSNSCIVLVNSQLTQDHKWLQHLNSLTSCLTLQWYCWRT